MSGTVVVRPSDLAACAYRLRGQADRLADARRDLARLLEHTGGAGGDSKTGRAFAAAYDHPAEQIVNVLGSLAVAMEATAAGLISMAATYEYLDEVIAADFDGIDPRGRRRADPQPPAIPSMPDQPAKTWLPSMLREGNGGSVFILMDVADAWGRAAGAVSSVRIESMIAMSAMLQDNQSPGLGAFAMSWQKWVAPDGYLDSVASSATSIAKYVADRAQAMSSENDFVGGFIGGLWDSTVGAVVGLGELAIKVIQNPTMLLDAAVELGKLQMTILTRPDIVFGTTVKFVQAAPGATASMIDYASHMSPHDWGYLAGQVTGVALTTVAGGELADVSELSKVGELADATKLGELSDASKLGELADASKLGELEDADGLATKASKLYERPSGFRQGIRDEAWDNATGADGEVRDPVTGKIMSKDDPWDMGHKPGYEFAKHQASAAERGIPRQQFLDEYNDASHYRPELPMSNQSHLGEAPADFNLWP